MTQHARTADFQHESLPAEGSTHNGHPIDDQPREPTTWEPMDLGPFLRGEVATPAPTVGARRADGLPLLYPGREHAFLGATESGKSWLALACVTAELIAEHHVVYIHFEEPDPGSTIERLRRIGVPDQLILRHLHFVAPQRPMHRGWLDDLVALHPTLVILDGVNEAMTLQGVKIDMEGWAAFRRNVVVPFKAAGAAVVECDHIPMNSDPTRMDAFGTVHKGATLDGARFVLTNDTPFGRRTRGASHVFVTKDRPGYLRAEGKPTRTPGKTFLATLTVDDTGTTPDFLTLYAPKAADDTAGQLVDNMSTTADTVLAVIADQPDQTVKSARTLFAALRQAGHQIRDEAVRDALADLILAGRVTEIPGSRGARGYRTTASRDQPTEPDPNECVP